MITLVAIACHLMSNMPLCEEVIVPSKMTAGKVFDPQTHETFEPIPFEMSMIACRSGDGLLQAQQWIATQMQYRGWYVKDVKCVPGKYEPRQRA